MTKEKVMRVVRGYGGQGTGLAVFALCMAITPWVIAMTVFGAWDAVHMSRFRELADAVTFVAMVLFFLLPVGTGAVAMFELVPTLIGSIILVDAWRGGRTAGRGLRVTWAALAMVVAVPTLLITGGYCVVVTLTIFLKQSGFLP